jgi:acyl-CoA reductase-like NAD-dependent aldehyde dehydrogenase
MTKPTTHDARDIGHIIGSDSYGEADEVIERLAPGTNEVVSRVLAGGSKEIAVAVTTARQAFDAGPWPQMPVAERAKYLHRVADLIDANAALLARLDAEESGKPISTAEGDIDGAAGLWRYAAALALTMKGQSFIGNGPDYTGLVLREPVGVVGLIIPWNFPALSLSQKLPFALAAGCTAVVKPSEFTSSSAHVLVKLIGEAGIPSGVVNLVVGDGRAGQALTESDGVDLVSFTGSTATGRRVMTAAAGNMKKISLELGGKAANIVFADADLEDAAAGVVHGVIFNNGECCVSQPRLLIADSIADEFVAEVAKQMRAVRVGQPLDPTTQLGALIHAPHLERVRGFVSAAAEHGGQILTGEAALTDPLLQGGQFMAPALIDHVAANAPIFQDEIFGPVLGVTRFSSRAEAISLATGVQYGLSNSLWSKNTDTVLDVAKALKSGTVYVNTTIDAPPQMPFGGYKASGIGREMGEAGFEEFTELKSISIRTGKRV